MKTLFSIDVNTNEINGQEFILRETDSELLRKLDEYDDILLGYQKKVVCRLCIQLLNI